MWTTAAVQCGADRQVAIVYVCTYTYVMQWGAAAADANVVTTAAAAAAATHSIDAARSRPTCASPQQSYTTLPVEWEICHLLQHYIIIDYIQVSTASTASLATSVHASAMMSNALIRRNVFS